MARKAKRQRKPKRAAKEPPAKPSAKPLRYPKLLSELRPAAELVRKLGYPSRELAEQFKPSKRAVEHAAPELEEARRVLDHALVVRDGLRAPPELPAPAHKATRSPTPAKSDTRTAQRHVCLMPFSVG